MIRLYHCPGTRSMRPLWALEETGLSYQLHILAYPPKHDTSYLQINPRATVPFMIDGDVSMNESVAMCQYIGSRAAESGLMFAPSDPQYGRWLNWLTFGEASLTWPLSVVIHYSELYAQMVPGAPVYPDVTDYYKKSCFDALAEVENALTDSDYLVAGRFTLADISVGYNFVLIELLGLQHELPPRLGEYWQRLKVRPAFQRVQAVSSN